MNTAYDICSKQSHIHSFFEQANQVFDNLKDHISAPEALGATHDLVEEHLLAQGREPMRLLYQAHLDIRSLARPEALPVGDDGMCRTHQRDDTSRQLNTLLGQVT